MDSDASTVEHSAIEIFGLAPQLRDDLQVHVQVFAGQTCYVIEDPVNSRFSRVGVPEYTLLSLLDGQTTLAEALGKTAEILGSEALNEQEAASLAKWLIDSGLATTSQSRTASRLAGTATRIARKKMAAYANPLFQKVALFCPEAILASLRWLARSTFNGWATTLWAITVLIGVYQVTSQWRLFSADTIGVLSASNWFWLVTTWLLLKVCHEAGHALACKRFGGTVREAGVLFVLFAPMPYVDVTSSWRFDSKWKRIVTAAAGMYVELFVAALAAMIWAWSDSPIVDFHARNIVVTAGLVTLLFNANPLMRFDGYYILSDWLELPNLATHGRQLLDYGLKRFALGMSVVRPEWPEGRLVLIAVYAVSALAWRIFISLLLIIAAESMFYGAGIVLAATALTVMAGAPLYWLARNIRTNNTVNKGRLAIVSCSAVLAAGAIWFLVPWQSSYRAPAIVDYDPVLEIRTPVAGFVREVYVRPGDIVEAGELLSVLENREVELRVQQLQLDIQQSLGRARKFRQAEEIAAYQVETDRRIALEERLAELNDQLRDLSVYSPADGQVLRSTLHERIGMYLEAGEATFYIGKRQDLRVFALIPQHKADALIFDSPDNIGIHLWGHDLENIVGDVEKVRPRATIENIFPALSAIAGGPIAVRAKAATQRQTSSWELTEPHVPVVITLSPSSDNQKIAAGQTGFVRLSGLPSTLGGYFQNKAERWLRQQCGSEL